MKKIVYNPVYKYGAVTQRDGMVYSCYFYEEKRHAKIIDSFLEDVDENLTEFIRNRKYTGRFYYTTERKGQAYYQEDRVKDLTYDRENGLCAEVKGTQMYHVSIAKRNGQVRMYCDCPVNGSCKHIYAACMKYEEVFDELSFFVQGIDEDLKRETERYRSEYREYDQHLLKILQLLIGSDEQKLMEYIRYADDAVYPRDRKEELFQAICYNDILRKAIIQAINNDEDIRISSLFKKKLKKTREICELNDRNEGEEIRYLLYNLSYQKLFDYLNTHRDSNNVPAIKEAIEHTVIDDDTIKRFIECSKEEDKYSFFTVLFFGRCNTDQKKRILTETGGRVPYTYEDIKDFSDEEKMPLLKGAEFRTEKECNDFLKNDLAKIEDRKTALAPLLNMSDTGSRRVYKKVTDIIRKYRNNEYVLELLEGRSNDYYRSYYERRFQRNKKVAEKVDPAAVDDYFDYEYSVYDAGNNSYLISYYLTAPNGKIAYHITKVLNEDAVLRNEDSYTIEESSFDDKDRRLANYVIEKAPEVLGEQYHRDLFEAQRKIDDAVQKKRLSAASRQMEVISERYLRSSIELPEERKAHLEYLFYISENNYDRRFELSLKVGIDKKYIVKNVTSFLNCFSEERTVSYGKNLTLTHNLENFRESDRKNLQLLSGADLRNSYYANRLVINAILFKKLLLNLQGHTVSINGQTFDCTLHSRTFQAHLEKDYVLKFDQDIKNIQLLEVDHTILILDNEKQTIDLLDCDKKENGFYLFVYDNEGLCIRDIAEEFKEKIYSIYPGLIEIAEDLKEDFKYENLLINAYFDYDDKCIRVRNEYLINNRPIEENAIKNRLDIIRKDNYLRYLANIGFQENVMTDEKDILNFFNMDFSSLKRFCNVYLSESIQNKKVSLFAPKQIRVSYSSNMMEAFLEDSEFTDSELEEIMKSIRKKKKFVLLSNDRIIDLSSDESQEFYETVKDLGLNEKKLLQPTQISIINSIKALAHENRCRIDDYLSNMINDISSFKNAGYEVPKLDAQLRPYQIDAYKWLRTLCKYHLGGILADDMGLGKTIEIISLIASDSTPKANLIVCPKSLIFNWKNEFAKFAPEEETEEIYGGKQQRKQIIEKLDPNRKITYITSYDSLNRDSELYDQKHFNYLIVDEAQAIKNVQALKTQSVKNIKADNRFALTGTPIENNMIDLWSIFDFIMPGYFPDLNEFKSGHDNEIFIQKVSRRIAPFVLRRTKTAVLKDLPPKYEMIMSCEMPAAQRKVYDAYKKQARDKLESGSSAFDVLPYLMRLRQICVDPSLFVDAYKGGSGKTQLLMEIVEDYLEKGHRILIFSQFVKALNVVAEKLRDRNIAYFEITGETSARKRIEIADRFNNGSSESVVLISLKAGGTGLNLIGADTVIHLDPWWNVAAENQASDRSHRIGQTRNVEIIKLICENSVEQRVIELQNIKKDLIDKLISDDDQTITNASLEDIRFILD